MTTLIARPVVMAALLLCGTTALPRVAAAADRALGADAVAICAALSGAGATRSRSTPQRSVMVQRASLAAVNPSVQSSKRRNAVSG